MKTYNGNLGEYILENTSDVYCDSFSLCTIIVNKPNWFNKLFPYFRTKKIQCHGFGFMDGFGDYKKLVLADEAEKDKIIQKQIEKYENRHEEKRIFREKLKATNEYLNK